MTPRTLARALADNFLGSAPDWYKLTVLGFLLLNPVVLALAGPFVTGWLLIAEFIFTLALALKCYPLQPGGLLAIEAVLLGLTSPEMVYEETLRNFPVILLLMFMVAGIFFLKELLLFTFTKLLLGLRSKVGLSLVFCGVAAVLSAFLDALTVIAVVITVAEGFYAVYHRVASGGSPNGHRDDSGVDQVHGADLEQFRGFLRGLMMHAAVGTALGGVLTIVGEPQNLLIGKIAGWEFGEFFLRVAPVSVPVFVAGLALCVTLELTRTFGFGVPLPSRVREVLVRDAIARSASRTLRERAVLVVQAAAAAFLVVALGLHLAEVGVIGLTVIVLATAFSGVVEERRIGHAFEEALPFTALLVVFFGVVAVIHDQQLFTPVIERVLEIEGPRQIAAFYLANGALSAISDNVFVATVYITEVQKAFEAGAITRQQFDTLAVAINTGTNIPSVATPNGQAAFLFLLTSGLAPLVRLSYGRMVWMALPYAVTLTGVGLLAVLFLL